MAQRRSCLVTIVVSGVLVGGFYLFTERQKRAKREEFAAELRWAREAGMATNALEMASIIKWAEPKENAALFYKKLKSPDNKFSDVYAALGTCERAGHLTRVELAKIRSLLAEFKTDLKLVEEGCRRPRCWFDRDWSLGCVVLSPEVYQLALVARLVALRGSLMAEEGRTADAIADLRRIMRIAQHIGEEPTPQAGQRQQAIYDFGVRQIAICSFKHRNKSAYTDELKSAIANRPKPNLKREFTGELFMKLSFTEYMTTPDGWRQLGLKDHDRSVLDNFMPILYDQQAARLEMVKASREMWAAFDAPLATRYARMDAAQERIDQASRAFLNRWLEFERVTPEERMQRWDARGLQFAALYRALRMPVIPGSIVTSDLLSPFDRKPVKYSFDGKQIQVEVTGKTYYGAILKLPIK